MGKMCFSLLGLAIAIAINVCLIRDVCGPPFICPDGYQNKSETCKECDAGLFRNGNMTVCTTFTVCQPDVQEVAVPGNSTHDVICRCTDPKFPIVAGKTCLPDPNCPAGSYFFDGLCEACPNGTWKNETGPNECFNCTQCNETSRECNATMDAICVHSGDVPPEPSTGGNSWTGTIVGIVVGFFVILIVVIILYRYCCKKDSSGSSWRSRFLSDRRSLVPSGSSPSGISSDGTSQPLMPSQNGNQSQSNANPNSQDPSTDRLIGSEQDENNDADNADGNNETSGQPSNGGESIPVDTSVVDNLSLPPVLPQPDLVAVRQQDQNGAPIQRRANEDPVNQNLNANQPLGGSQQNGSINPQNGGVVDPQVAVNPRTPSALFQSNPAHGHEEEQAPSLCSFLRPNDGSGRDTSVAGVAETPAAPLLDPTSQGIVSLREDPSIVSRTPSLPSQVPSLPSQVPSLPSQVPGAAETPLWDYEDCITKNYKAIYYYLTSLDYIRGALLENGILTHEQMLDIKQIEKNRSSRDAIDELIRSMRLKGNNGFVCFIQALVAKETKLDELARRIHPQLAEKFIKERDSELEDPTEDQQRETEPLQNASSGNNTGVDDVDYGRAAGETPIKAIGSDETKIKAIGSDETKIKAIGSDETKIKAIGSDETKLKAIDSGETKLKAIGSEETNIKTIDSGKNQLRLDSVD